ncbi:MAG: HAD-IC family P-type ATPase [Lachnospiraceae bacterium]|nr:HAD-IC family P-type ATPase [Lachnospiraceae bacterium]
MQSPAVGLSSDEVSKRVREGKTNLLPENTGKSVGAIIRDNTLTYFNFIFIILAIFVVIAGSYNSLTFLPVVIANTLIGIFQQLRAKKVIDRLTLLSISEYEAVRDGAKKKVRADKLVQDDCIFLSAGQQVPADGTVIGGEASLNESLLTGEADEIEKTKGSKVLSGSFVVSGKCLVRLDKVGSESYAAKLSAQAKKVHDKKSEMIKSIDIILKVAGFLIIPIGIALFYQSYVMNGNGFSESIISTIGCVIGMIPEGLYLLVTVSLAVSTAKLAVQKVLLHDMRSIETLARVDMICVDKTGTITDNKMKVTELFAPRGRSLSDNEKALLSWYISTMPDANATAMALKEELSSVKRIGLPSALKVNPFDSKKKYSEVETNNGVYRLGAPEFLLEKSVLSNDQEKIDSLMSKGQRVIAFTKDNDVVLFAALENSIRDSAAETFSFFNKQGVGVKVISGDNPLTVSKIAERAGIPGSEHYIDMSQIPEDDDMREVAKNYTVFGRVRPEQKKALVRAMKRDGLKVAMTGDGVNDILAMKEADCSIAMGSGCEAAANAAQVVLLDSDFSHMKQIVSEGRNNINNITRSATLFLYKNLFSLFLAIFSLISVLSYPLVPSQVTLISAFNIGLPALFLTFEINNKKQSDRFILTVLIKAMPAAITSFFFIAAMVVFGQVFEISKNDVSIASTFLLAVVGYLILFEITKPMNGYRLLVFFGCIGGMILAAIIFPSLFSLSMISERTIMLFVIFAIAEVSMMRFLIWLFETIEKKLVELHRKKKQRRTRV